MRIILVPIEPYEERYTEQWYRWIPKALSQLNVDYLIVDGARLTDKIEHGSVLDVYGTHHYKFDQLRKLMAMLRDGTIRDDDILFFYDLWFPGIEALQYVRDMTHKRFKITGVLHAGTWDIYDFTALNGMWGWGRSIEKGWLQLVDKVFVGSAYHRTLILSTMGIEFADKVHNTGLPFEWSEVSRESEKENIVVFPHRLDVEKQPVLFALLLGTLYQDYPNWRFIKTALETSTKEEYYQILGRAKVSVSFALQETFGYSMLESLANGCIPVVPNRLSYSTMDIYNGCRYGDYTSAVEMVRKAMDGSMSAPAESHLEQYRTKTVMQRMIECL